MTKWALSQECKDSLISANQSMWYTTLTNWKIKTIWLSRYWFLMDFLSFHFCTHTLTQLFLRCSAPQSSLLWSPRDAQSRVLSVEELKPAQRRRGSPPHISTVMFETLLVTFLTFHTHMLVTGPLLEWVHHMWVQSLLSKRVSPPTNSGEEEKVREQAEEAIS